MKENSGKPIAVERPRDRNRPISNELLVVADDEIEAAINVDPLELLRHLSQKGGRSVRVLTLERRLTAGFLRRSWVQLAEVGAVHLQLSRTSLLTPAVISLLMAARFFGRRVTALITGSRADLDGDKLRRQSFVLRLIDHLAVQSPYLHEQLRRHNVACRLLPVPVAQRWYLDRVIESVQPIIMWAGECDEQSHLEVAIRAFQTVKQKYPRAELLVACPGAGSSSRFEALELPGIQLIDSHRPDRLQKAYARADVFLNTSIVDSQPVALLRAMAAGLPVISAAVGSLKQLIENGESGILVPLDSHARFADSLIDLVESDELVSRLSKGSRILAREYRFTNGERSWRHFLGFGC